MSARSLWLIAAAAWVGCEAPPTSVPQDAVPTVYEEGAVVSLILEQGWLPSSGDMVVAVRVEGEVAVGVVEGVLEWNPLGGTLVGQAHPDGSLVLVNDASLSLGRAPFIAVAPTGVADGRMAHFVFEVPGGRPSDLGLRILVETVGSLDGQPLEVGSIGSGDAPSPMGVEPEALVSPETWELRLETRDSVAPVRPRPGGPSLVPGASEVFGDATQDGVVDGSDVLFGARVAVELLECFVGTTGGPGIGRDCIAANVRPANPPGLGEPLDDCGPGIDACGTLEREVDGQDVLAIAREAVGIDEDIVGELIPRAPVSPDTVFLSGDLGASRKLARDTLYILQGRVSVGTGTTAGELTVAAGTRLEGDGPGSALVIGRNGRIFAEGTPYEPVVLTCRGAPTPGCWDGLFVNGNAPINFGSPSSAVGTRDGTGGCLENGGGSLGLFGNCVSADSSGVLRWVRVLNGGAADLPSVHLRGVGSGTTVEQLYIVGSQADALRVAGGIVGLRDIRVIRPGRAGLAWNLGWIGRLQYAVIQAGVGSLRLIDGSNLVGSPDAAPRSAPHLRNVTLVGVADPAAAPLSSGSIRLHGGTAGTLRSLLVHQQPTPNAFALDVDDPETFDQLMSGALTIESSVFGGFAGLGDLDVDPAGPPNTFSPDVEGGYLRSSVSGNTILSSFSVVDSILRGPWEGVPDLRLVPASSSASIVCEVETMDPWFEPVSFCGAVPAPAFVGEIPWFEPAPAEVFSKVAFDPEPVLLHIAVVDTASGMTIPGVLLEGPTDGVTQADGFYHAYVPSVDGFAVYSLKGDNFPPGCEPLGQTQTLLNLVPRDERTEVFGAVCF